MSTRDQHSMYPLAIRDLEVLDTYDITPLMRRVVLTGEQLGAFQSEGYHVEPFRTDNADDHVKLILLDPDDPTVAPPRQRDGYLEWTPGSLGRGRDYTPRRYDAKARVLELDVVRHRGGLASEWVERVRPGDRLLVAGPRGTTTPPEGIDWYFLVGDESALPAILRRIEGLAPGTPVTAVVSVASASEKQDVDHDELDLTWVCRDTTGASLMAAIEAARWRPGQVYAWGGGEAGVMRPIRRWFTRDRGVEARYSDISGYWRAGRTQPQMDDE